MPPSTRATSSCAGCISAQWKGALTGSITARRAPLALADCRRFLHCGQCAGDDRLSGRVEVGGRDHQSCFRCGVAQASATARRIERQNCRHRALACGNGQLHCAAACLHRPHSIGKLQRACSHMRRPLAQGVTCGQRWMHAMFRQHAQRSHAHRQNGRLRVLGELQVFFRALQSRALKRANPQASSASAKVCAATGKRSARSRPMPTDCEPCPGKRNAIFLVMTLRIVSNEASCRMCGSIALQAFAADLRAKIYARLLWYSISGA